MNEIFNPKINKEDFENLLMQTNRRYIKDLIVYLNEETDFYTAPASSNYHGNYKYGLLEHSGDVYNHLTALIKLYQYPIKEDSIIIIGLLHDLCKANFYHETTRNRKIENKWIQEPYFSIEDKCPLGHGEKSVILLQQYIQLTMEEIFSIRWHMMSYDASVKDYAGNCALTASLNLYPIISLVHCADLLSISHTLKSEE